VPHKGAAEGVIQELLKEVHEVTGASVVGKPHTVWTGAKDQYGKPVFYHKGSYYQPHRVIYEHRYGHPLRQSDWVYRDTERCREILCMTPEHMSVSSENSDGTRTRYHAAVSVNPAGLVLPPVARRAPLVLPKRPPGKG
jgi:hypothetical protein